MHTKLPYNELVLVNFYEVLIYKCILEILRSPSIFYYYFLLAAVK